MKESKYHSLILLGLLLLFIIVVYNLSVSPVNDDYEYKDKKYNLLVPTYGQNSYVSEKNKLNNLNQYIPGEESAIKSKASMYEDRKQLRMDICNLCYDDLENDTINMMQTPKALYITP